MRIIKIGAANLIKCHQNRHVEISPINLGKIGAAVHQPRGGVREIIAFDLECYNPFRQRLEIFVGRMKHAKGPGRRIRGRVCS